MQITLQVQVPAERVTAIAFSPDGNLLAAVTWAGCIFLYSKCHRKQGLTCLAAVTGETDIQAAETSEEKPHSQDNPALPDEVSPGTLKAGPDEALSRLAWIEHGAQGEHLCGIVQPYCGLSRAKSLSLLTCLAPCFSWHGHVMLRLRVHIALVLSIHQYSSSVQDVSVAALLVCKPFHAK